MLLNPSVNQSMYTHFTVNPITSTTISLENTLLNKWNYVLEIWELDGAGGEETGSKCSGQQFFLMLLHF